MIELVLDNFRGVGYTKSATEAAERYALMLGVIREPDTSVTILDLGCGLGHLLDFIESRTDYRHLEYAGLDISSRYLDAARARHPQHEFILTDVLESDEQLRIFDYVVLNGVFNFRGPIERGDMLRYWQQLTTTAYPRAANLAIVVRPTPRDPPVTIATRPSDAPSSGVVIAEV